MSQRTAPLSLWFLNVYRIAYKWVRGSCMSSQSPIAFTSPIVSFSMAHLVVLVASGLVLYSAWLLVRNYVVRSPLDKIPGPPSGSFLSGV